jgi:hypothetical protein
MVRLEPVDDDHVLFDYPHRDSSIYGVLDAEDAEFKPHMPSALRGAEELAQELAAETIQRFYR